jgi:hypothetical protein
LAQKYVRDETGRCASIAKSSGWATIVTYSMITASAVMNIAALMVKSE